TESVPSGVSPYVVTIKGSTNEYDFPGNAVAFFTPFVGPSRREIWQNFSRGEITLDVRRDGHAIGSDAADRQATIAHELGHALKLAHPHVRENLANVPNGRGGYLYSNEVASIMNQGSIYGANNATAYPSTHDIINLKNKWGY
ncbi:MAG: hypothetical protein ACLSVG_10475, partial [Clostridia bacterium]